MLVEWKGVLEGLKRLRARLSNPRAWTYNAIARDAQGVRCEPNKPYACCWCLTGAVAVDIPSSRRYLIYTALVRALGEDDPNPELCLMEFNDMADRTHGEILALIDKAILEEEGRGV